MRKQRLTITLCILTLFFPLLNASAGTILSAHKYAWSNNIGYINFENVIVGDSALSGYAWSENKGFIKFNPALGGVSNNGAGNLSGSAWGEQLGWIDFDNVSIDGTTGKFSGTATGTLIGTLTFDCGFCDVETDWREADASDESSSGNGSGSFPNVSITPATLSNITIPNASLNTEFFTAVNQRQSAPIANNNIPPLFDIVSAPVPSTRENSAPIALSVVAGAIISMLALFVAKKIRVYRIAKTKTKNEII